MLSESQIIMRNIKGCGRRHSLPVCESQWKSFSFTFSSKEKVKLLCKRSKDVDRGRNLSYNLFKPSSPPPLGRNFKENHFENYIFSEYICQTSNLKEKHFENNICSEFQSKPFENYFL